MAVLLNPPSASSGTRTRNAVARAASALEYDRAVFVNLCSAPTATVLELNAVDREAWARARPQLEAAIGGAGGVIAGWGVAGLSGDARRWMCAQVEWLMERAQQHGTDVFWTVGGEPRHPSRWHQYVSDKYGRTTGGTFEERIAQVLVAKRFRPNG